MKVLSALTNISFNLDVTTILLCYRKIKLRTIFSSKKWNPWGEKSEKNVCIKMKMK